MYYDSRIRKWAEVMTTYTAPVREGAHVLIRSTTLAEPLVVELVRAVLERGGLPHLRMAPPVLEEIFFRYAAENVLDALSDIEMADIERADILYSIMSGQNTRALTRVEPQKMVRVQRARQPWMETYMRRAATDDLLWTLTLFPTPAYAQDAEMGLLDLFDFVFEACFLNEPDPVARWQQMAARQQQLIDVLSKAREIHVKGPGTDLRVGVEGRIWLNDDGKKNFPGGEIFTGPVEESVEGVVSFELPAVYAGREVRGARLRFEKGRVVEASATHNEAFLLETLNTDEGARYLGEFAFGTNYNIQQVMRNTLFDEKIGGTIHMALGRSYPETGGKNQSAIHWDLVCELRRDSEVYVDGELFQKNGRFVMFEDGIV